jgi:hypothetical protein
VLAIGPECDEDGLNPLRQEVEAIVLRTINPQPSLWEAVLPECLLGLPAELVAVDRLLDEAAFFEPYRAHFHATLGRPSIPIETYLRMMFLKFRHHLSYEVLCAEVADSISWRRFCHISFGAATPHPTTLMKITTRCGPATVRSLNEALLTKAAGARLIKLEKVAPLTHPWVAEEGIRGRTPPASYVSELSDGLEREAERGAEHERMAAGPGTGAHGDRGGGLR